MTKDEALDLALEALENWREFDPENFGEIDNKAITAIKQVRALDKKAENARELGLDYEPAAPVQEDWGPGPHECHSLTAAPVQEPVAWRYRGILHDFDPSDWAEGPVTPLYTTPPAAKRQWVGLSEQELKAIWYDAETGGAMLLRFAEAIEAKLRSKNNDS